MAQSKRQDCSRQAEESLFQFDNTYALLPERFYARLAPTKVSAPRLICVNRPLAEELGLDPGWLASQDGVAALAGNSVPEGADPLAMAYAGHQFGHFVPQLGDGRAILLGEVRARDGARYDVQLKGCGRTPFSRNGDGRAALGPVLREYILSEAMHAFGIPTTRALAVVATGEMVLREQGMLPGAVLTRVAKSHVRVGTFEFFAGRGDAEGVENLADYVIERLYPNAAAAPNPYLSLLEATIARTAGLIARWQLVGFIHGVMNTDNASIAGETIDYGPCAFIDTYHPATVFSSIDHGGRYAYDRQPRIAYWNLSRFAQTLFPLLGKREDQARDAAQKALDAYPALFDMAYMAGLRGKFGFTESRDGDVELGRAFFRLMTESRADFTLAFRRLCDSAEGCDDGLGALFGERAALAEWLASWRQRLAPEDILPADRAAGMRAVNPAFIPRNHRVEAAIVAAQERGDFAPFEELLKVLSAPYDERSEFARYADPPQPNEIVRQTFCGT
ncbi:MAG TPA: YdiU family protein [Rhizomicrobium sp.]